MVIIKFDGEQRVFMIGEIEGWKNCMISLMRSRREYTVEYFDL